MYGETRDVCQMPQIISDNNQDNNAVESLSLAVVIVVNVRESVVVLVKRTLLQDC